MRLRFTLLSGGLGLILALEIGSGLGPQPGPAWAAAPERPATADGGFITVTVQSGESLATYARIYGVSGAALSKVNNLRNPDLVFPGQVLVIPVVKSFTPSLTTPFYYTVQRGDTLGLLAQRYEMQPDVIANANGLTDDIVILGRTYLIPAGPHMHIIQRGESIVTIAARFHTTVDHILSGNNLPNPDRLYAGQPIWIPVIFDAQPVPFTPVAVAAPTLAPLQRPSTATPVPVVGSYIRTTVQSGESFVTYTFRYGVSGGALRAANRQLRDPDIIYAGTLITIPVVASFTPSRTTPFFYVVARGDTTASIAAKFEMSTDTLIGANPGANFTAGGTILVPAGPHTYIVKAGDTVASIAAKYGMTAQDLLIINPSLTYLYVGRPVFIPIQYDRSPVPF